MSHDVWRDELWTARGDPQRLLAVLASGTPSDGLQLAGSAVMSCPASTELSGLGRTLAVRLRERDWPGDAELADRLTTWGNSRPGTRRPLAVDLAELADLIDGPFGSESYVDIATGATWPAEVLEMDAGPDDLDLADTGRWLLVEGEGSRIAYAEMERFIESVQSAQLRERLAEAIGGRKPFRAFAAALAPHAEEFTRWNRYRDDARIGRARYWLAVRGFDPASPVR